MSPSKMRKSQWYRQGEDARLFGQPRTSNPYDGDPSHYVRRRAWFQGWDEGQANEAERNPPMSDFESAMARGDLATAVLFAGNTSELKDILSAVIERLP